MANEKQIKPIWWWILVIAGFCILCLLMWCLFGLKGKDFVTAAIGLGGVVGVVISIFQTQKRISQQEKQQRDARFAAGVELLGNPHESTRIGGAYNLYFLAREHKEYLTPVCEILCAHIRTITSDKDYQEQYKDKSSNEVETIIHLLLIRKENDSSIFKYRPKNLSGAFISGLYLGFKHGVTVINRVNFSNAIITDVDLHAVELTNTYFEGAILRDVKFGGTRFEEVNFRRSMLIDNDFEQANLSYVSFEGAELTNCIFLRAKLNVVSFMCSLESFYKDGKLLGNQKYTKLQNVTFSSAKEFKHVNFSTAELIEPVNFSLTPLQGYSFEQIVEPNFSLDQTKSEAETSIVMGAMHLF